MNLILSFECRIMRPWMQKNFSKTKYGHQLSAFKDVHNGKRCFIVANGPSLRVEDLELLHKNGEITFAMNRIYKIFDSTHWRPTYYLCEDELIAKDIQDEINAIEANAKFVPIQFEWWHDIHINNAHRFYLNYTNEKRFKYNFSPNIEQHVDCGGTVTFTCMQFAAYMGFSEIYLLGVDHNFQKTVDIHGNLIIDNSVKDYFCEGYDDDIKDSVVHNMGNNTRAYMNAKNYCDETKRTTIYNATRGGKLEVFQRVNFDELFIED